MALTEKNALAQQYVASAILRQMDKHHFEQPVRHELLDTLRTIPTGTLALGKIRKDEYLRKLDEADFEDYPLYGDI